MSISCSQSPKLLIALNACIVIAVGLYYIVIERFPYLLDSPCAAKEISLREIKDWLINI